MVPQRQVCTSTVIISKQEDVVGMCTRLYEVDSCADPTQRIFPLIRKRKDVTSVIVAMQALFAYILPEVLETAFNCENCAPTNKLILTPFGSFVLLLTMATAVEVQDHVKIALSSFLAEVAARTSGWWYLIDQEMFDGQEAFDCNKPTPRLSSLMDCTPMMTSWILFNAGLSKTSTKWRLTTKPWGPQMMVESTAWRQFAYEFGLPLEIAHLSINKKDCFFVRIGEIPQLSDAKLKIVHQNRSLPNSYSLKDILQDVSQGSRTEPKKPRFLAMHATQLITNVAEATGFSKILSKISIINSSKEILDKQEQQGEENNDNDDDMEEENVEASTTTTKGTAIGVAKEDNMDEDDDRDDLSLVTSLPFALPTTPLDGICQIEDFPAFHKFGIRSQEDLSAILTDIQKYHGDKPLWFKYKGNQKPGAYILVHQVSSHKKYRAVTKNQSFLQQVLQLHSAGNNPDFDENDAARAMIRCLHDQYNTEFVGVCDDAGMVMRMKQMDAITAATMFEKAGITVYGRRIISQYLRATFGKKCMVTEREVREVSESFIKPTNGIFEWIEDPSKQRIPSRIRYWWKDVSDILLDSIKNDFQVTWNTIVDVRLVFGGDHGGGVFRMFLRVIIRSNDYSTVDHRTYQIGQVDSPKDKAFLLKNTISPGISDSVKKITSQHKKVSILLDKTKVKSVLLGQLHNALVLPVRMHFTGDLKFLFQVVGRDGMCGSWCFWCRLSPGEWCLPVSERSGVVEPRNMVKWTLEGIESHKVATLVLSEATLKKPSIVRGTIHNEEAVWDFVDICDFFLPVLHVEIGLTNDVLGRFFEFVDERLEPLLPEEEELRSRKIRADVISDRAKNKKKQFLFENEPVLKQKRDKRKELKKEMTKLKTKLKKKKNPTAAEGMQFLQNLEAQVATLDDAINSIMVETERLTAEITICKVQFETAKKALDVHRKEIGKIGWSLRSQLDDKFENFGVSAAAYHGGKLNGVACRALMEQAEIVFDEAQVLCLLFAGKTDANGKAITATRGEVEKMCKVYSTLLRLLGAAFSIMRRAWGEATEKDGDDLKELLNQIEKLWRKLELSWTPKFHGLQEHSVEQLLESKGYKEFQEDWVEAGHQTGGRDLRIYRSVKDDAMRANCLSRAEKVRNNNEVAAKTLEIKEETKQKRKKVGPTMKESRKKEKQDTKAMAPAAALEVAKTVSPTKILTGYETLKTRFNNDEGGEV